jgi:hypothetical protein
MFISIAIQNAALQLEGRESNAVEILDAFQRWAQENSIAAH